MLRVDCSKHVVTRRIALQQTRIGYIGCTFLPTRSNVIHFYPTRSKQCTHSIPQGSPNFLSQGLLYAKGQKISTRATQGFYCKNVTMFGQVHLRVTFYSQRGIDLYALTLANVPKYYFHKQLGTNVGLGACPQKNYVR